MFFGEYEYRVDEKGRVPLPPKFRRDLKEAVVLTKGTDKCIAVYPFSEWKRLADTLAAKTVTSANLRKLNRAIFGSAFSAAFDRQRSRQGIERFREGLCSAVLCPAWLCRN